MKPLFGIFVGLSTAALIIVMAEMISEGLYPRPNSMYTGDISIVTEWFNQLPTKAFIIIAISHGFAAFAAGLISSLVAVNNRMAYGVISFCCIFIPVLVFLFTYYFPTWFVITDTIVTAIIGFSGVVIGSGRYVN